MERIMDLCAQDGREGITPRTKKALAVAKARGVELGNPNGAASLRRAGKGGATLRATVSANAAAFADDLAPVLADIRAAGHTSLRAVATERTARGIRTRRGACGAWVMSADCSIAGDRSRPLASWWPLSAEAV
jgi:hypothetical protein